MPRRKKASTERPEIMGLRPMKWRRGPNKMDLFRPKRKPAAKRVKRAKRTVSTVTVSARKANPGRLARLQRQDKQAEERRLKRLYGNR